MPIPRKRKGEKKTEYIQRLIRHYIEEGYPQKQAIAIAINVANKKYKSYSDQYLAYLPIL